MQPASRRIEGADGLVLHVLEWSREGVPLLLVHGFGNDAHIWDDLAPTLAPCYRTLAVDLRGHGDSDRDPQRRYDYDSHVRDLEALAGALGIGRMVLVGHSLGGRIATLFAGRHPERMAGLVIVDSGPEMDPRGTTRIRMEVAQRGDGSFASPAEYERILAHNYPAAQPAAIARMARTELRRRADGRYERKLDPAFHAARGDVDETTLQAQENETTRLLWEALRRIPCPTLVIRGAASDILSADVADRMAEDVLPDGRLAVVPRAAHSVMTDNPEGFAEAVAAFALA
jgi:pimeloyl-ACP methyl ester carboxylesterase